MLQNSAVVSFALGLLYLLENIHPATSSSSYSWHYSVQPGRYVRYSSTQTGHTIRRLPAAIVRHQIGNHVTSYELPPIVPMLGNTRWVNHPYHVPVVHHPPSFFAPNRPPITAPNQPIQPSRIAPLPNNNDESPPALAPAESTSNTLSRPSNSRPVVSPATAGRPVSRRPNIIVPPPPPQRTRPPTRPPTAAAAPNFAVTRGPAPSSVTVNDADIGFEVTSNSDSASLGGPVSPGSPARSVPVRIPSGGNRVDSNADESSSIVDPTGF